MTTQLLPSTQATPASLPRILIVEDEQLSAAGSAFFLSKRFDVVGIADDVTEAVELICNRRPDLVLLDLRIGEGRGADVIQEARKLCPDIRFLVLTASTRRQDVQRMFRLGVAGYITKGTTGADLPDRVAEALNGGRPISRQVAGLLLDLDEETPPADGIERLTRREREVVRLVTRGFTYKEIAFELGIAVKTLENHMHSIFRKVTVASRHELTALAFETGFS